MEEVLRALDQWVVSENAAAATEGLPAHKPCTIRVVGQLALLEAGVGLVLAATQDVDAYADFEWPVQKKLEELLVARGKLLDPLGHEAWMPEETEY